MKSPKKNEKAHPEDKIGNIKGRRIRKAVAVGALTAAGLAGIGLSDSTPKTAESRAVEKLANESNTSKTTTSALEVAVGPSHTTIEPIVLEKPGSPDSRMHDIVLSPEVANNVIPQSILEMFERDTVFIPPSGCSGKLIFSETGQPIGVVTADHCKLRGFEAPLHGPRYSDEAQYVRGEDDRLYLVEPSSYSVLGGEFGADTVPRGTVESLWVPAGDDREFDFAIGAFAGVDPAEVFNRYNSQRVVPGEIKRGEIIYIAGFPQHQPGAERINRQEFALQVLGEEVVITSFGEQIKTVWAAGVFNKDKAMCSFGISGAVAVDAQGKAVGPTAFFQELRRGGLLDYSSETADLLRRDIEERLGVSLDGVDFVCGFALKTPADDGDGSDMRTAKVVRSFEEIPGYNVIPPEQQMDLAREYLTNPKTEKTILSGMSTVTYRYDYETKLMTTYRVENPLMYYDERNDRVIVGYYDKSGNLVLDYPVPRHTLQLYGIADSNNGLSGSLAYFDGLPEFDPADGRMKNKGKHIGSMIEIATEFAVSPKGGFSEPIEAGVPRYRIIAFDGVVFVMQDEASQK